MILVDTSVWIDHFHRGDSELNRLLAARSVCMHSAVVGELAMGNLSQRASVLAELRALPAAREATSPEVLDMVETRRLFGRGISYVDAQLLTSAALNGDRLWVRDKRTRAAAKRLGIAHDAE